MDCDFHPDVLDRRRETVEHPFGTTKQWMNQGAFLMRGLEKESIRICGVLALTRMIGVKLAG